MELTNKLTYCLLAIFIPLVVSATKYQICQQTDESCRIACEANKHIVITNWKLEYTNKQGKKDENSDKTFVRHFLKMKCDFTSTCNIGWNAAKDKIKPKFSTMRSLDLLSIDYECKNDVVPPNSDSQKTGCPNEIFLKKHVLQIKEPKLINDDTEEYKLLRDLVILHFAGAAVRYRERTGRPEANKNTIFLALQKDLYLDFIEEGDSICQFKKTKRNFNCEIKEDGGFQCTRNKNSYGVHNRQTGHLMADEI